MAGRWRVAAQMLEERPLSAQNLDRARRQSREPFESYPA